MIPPALRLLAVDPRGLAGAVLRGRAGPGREALLAAFHQLLPADAPRRRVPPGITADRLIGGLDLAATLAAGRPVYDAGLLAAVKGGVACLPMAERAAGVVLTALLGMLDGADGQAAAALLALDESSEDEPPLAAALRERLAFSIELDAAPSGADPSERFNPLPADHGPEARRIAAARRRLPRVEVPAEAIEALCRAALALGIGSSRAELLAVRAARASAALAGRNEVAEADLTLAAELVLAPRATRVPSPEEAAPPPEQAPPPPGEGEQAEQPRSNTNQLPDRVLEAAMAALPAHLLARLVAQAPGKASGRAGAGTRVLTHGRRVGARVGDPRRGARLDLVETLRAAAPWQRLRQRRDGRLAIRRDDFRIQRLVHRTGSTVIFAVDASGSSALNRLNEAKGAVELLLAESYVRRDRVALISFRGTRAELVLPPTRSLARARRALVGLPGGGGTPLASALMAGERVARQVARDQAGGPAILVLLTDGRANVALDGSGGRPRAESDAREAARGMRAAGVPVIFIDTAPRPGAFAPELARIMDARYLPLPVADARHVCDAVRAVSQTLERSA